MAIINTNVATMRRRLSESAMQRLCEDYDLSEHEDGATELHLTTEELAAYGWSPARELTQAPELC